MKKLIFLIIPALFLFLGAKQIKQTINKNNTQNKQMLSNLKTGLEKSKEISVKKPETSEGKYPSVKEISLGQEIVLQGETDSKIEQKTFKLNLPKSKYTLLYNQETFITTHNKNVIWNWTELAGKYFYKISVKLDKEQNCLFITTTPTLRATIVETSYTTFSLSKDKNSIFFDGVALGMNTHTFHRPILYIE
ncbi:MAG: hypothetical protein II972_02715 [Elusimicrobiaceae bacterium]|nr:hypothetical protein [Elusimicrobiaceae bacterium]